MSDSEFSAIRLLYPLFCAIFHLKFGLPKLKATRKPIRVSDYPKISVALDDVDELLARIKESESEHEDLKLSTEERRFYDAFSVHWVHADKRTTMADFICKKIIAAI